jgi:hypothetical protein
LGGAGGGQNADEFIPSQVKLDDEDVVLVDMPREFTSVQGKLKGGKSKRKIRHEVGSHVLSVIVFPSGTLLRS